MLISRYLLIVILATAVSSSVTADVTFTDINATMIGVRHGEAQWGDYDGDGDLDVALIGESSSGGICKIYRNNNGTFSDANANISPLWKGRLEWGDYDKDGDLDLAVAGNYAINIYRNNNGSFSNTTSGMTGYAYCDINWGDFDNDGDLDLVVGGKDNAGRLATKILRNDNNTFTDMYAGLAGVDNLVLDSGDYEGDGDIDILIIGKNAGVLQARLYVNDNAVFTPVDLGINMSEIIRAQFCDYDSDGDLDLAVAGMLNTQNVTKILRNDSGSMVEAQIISTATNHLSWGDYDNDGDWDLFAGNWSSNYIYRNDSGVFTAVQYPIAGVSSSYAECGDYDNDGDLDLIILGDTEVNGTFITKIYRSTGVTPNTPPSAPNGVSAAVSNGKLVFSWNAATDAQTPSAGLSYNLRVGTTPGAGDVYASMSNLSTGLRRLPLNGSSSALSWGLKGLAAKPYYWSVQAIDSSYAGSVWSTEIIVSPVTISGYVRDADGTGVSGVNVSADNGGTSGTTISSGYYSVTVLPGWSGTLTINKPGHYFSPSSRTYENVATDLTDQDFTSYRWFSDVYTSLEGLAYGAAVWGDYDGDGDLDLAIAGNNGDTAVSSIYRNDGGSFTNINAGLVGVKNGSLAWGDYDGDGDLDLAVAGITATTGVAKIYRNDSGTFNDSGAILTGAKYCSLAWGDYDNDGDLDLVITGLDGDIYTTMLYTNDNGLFTGQNAGIPGVTGGSIAWADYDKDGDLDLAISGYTGSRQTSEITRVYRNNNGVLSEDMVDLIALSNSSLAWGDYDNDGDLDLAVSGDRYVPYTTERITRIYRNDDGTLVDSGIPLTGMSRGSLAWGDYDNDGDLDLAMSGLIYSTVAATKLFRNDGGAFTELNTGIMGYYYSFLAWGDSDNDGDLDLLIAGLDSTTYLTRIYENLTEQRSDAPAAPTGLTAAIGNQGIAFSWNAATDTETPAGGLSYNLRVGTTPGGSDVFSGMADEATGRRYILATGNAQKNLSWTLENLQGGTYYWSVQAIDSGCAASPWAEEQAVTFASISGHVISTSGEPITNALVSTGSAGHWVYSDQQGFYCLPVTPGWSGTVSVEKMGFNFTPPSRIYSNVDGNQTEQDYTGTPWFAGVDVGIPGLSSSAVAWGDYDGDGDLDLAVSGYKESTASGTITSIYRNNSGVFTDINAGLPPTFSGCLAWGDYDNDGDLDLLVGDYQESMVYRNDAGTFVNTNAALVDSMNPVGAWGDYDNDGDLDLALVGEGYATGKLYRNNNGVLVDSGANLRITDYASLAWGDYDNDGDLDLLIAGSEGPYDRRTRIFRNDAGTLVETNPGIVSIYHGSVAWADYDNDGDLDIAIAGDSANGNITRIYRNDSGTFTDIQAGLPGVTDCDIAWTDYDDDGDSDLFVAGNTGDYWIVTIFDNQGGTFREIDTGFDIIKGGAFAWGDFDNDGDLDLAAAGSTGVDQRLTRIYRNDFGRANTPPASPTGLAARLKNGKTLVSWNAGSDAETPSAGLSYNLRIGTQPGRNDIFSGMADPVTGHRLLPAIGNVQQNRSWALKGLEPGVYYCAVQAIDNAFAGSPWCEAVIAVAQPTSLAVVKQLPDGSAAACEGRVTAIFDGFFYIESEDRISGIRVAGNADSIIIDSRVAVAGVVYTNPDGERYIQATSVEMMDGE